MRTCTRMRTPRTISSFLVFCLNSNKSLVCRRTCDVDVSSVYDDFRYEVEHWQHISFVWKNLATKEFFNAIENPTSHAFRNVFSFICYVSPFNSLCNHAFGLLYFYTSYTSFVLHCGNKKTFQVINLKNIGRYITYLSFGSEMHLLNWQITIG